MIELASQPASVIILPGMPTEWSAPLARISRKPMQAQAAEWCCRGSRCGICGLAEALNPIRRSPLMWFSGLMRHALHETQRNNGNVDTGTSSVS
jgi:hypothetical protein